MNSEFHNFFSLAFQPHISGGCGGDCSTPLMEHENLHEDRSHSRQSLSPASYTSSIGVCTYISSLLLSLGSFSVLLAVSLWNQV
jgi:hypothetical protein